MTLLVRDEQDLIQDNIEYHRSQGVDFFIATDNRSVDRTTEILYRYQNKGILKYIWEDGDDFQQNKWVTRMARLAHIEYDADWVINNDADEFWWPISGSLKTSFSVIPESYSVVTANRHNFVPIRMTGDSPFYDQMIYRMRTSVNAIGGVLPPKVAHRGCEEISVAPGNHSVEGFVQLAKLHDIIEVFHFPIRTYEQFVNKTENIGASYKKNSTRAGEAQRTMYEKYKAGPENLKRYFEDAVYCDQKLKEETASGNILKDDRLSSYFARLEEVK